MILFSLVFLVFEALIPLIFLSVFSIFIYAAFLGIKFLFPSLPSNPGIKAAPLGYAASILVSIAFGVLIYIFPKSPQWLDYCFFALSIASGLVVVWRMTIFFFNKDQQWKVIHPEIQHTSLPKCEGKPRFGCGISLFFINGIAISLLTYMIFHMWLLPVSLLPGQLLYNNQEKIPLQDLPDVEASISLEEHKIGSIPGNESAFNLVIEPKDGNVLKYPEFIINAGSHYQVAIHHIDGQTREAHGWLQFSNDGQLQYLNLNSLKLTDELPDEFENAPRKFIGIYERGKIDTNAKDPELNKKIK